MISASQTSTSTYLYVDEIYLSTSLTR